MAEQDFNAQVIEEYRANGGKVGGMFEKMSLLLLHHTGAKSGQERIAPLAYAQDGSRYVIFASKAGAPTNPGWYHNLDAQVQRTPGSADYEKKAGDRVIPVIALTATRDAG